jgi:hypothetical protein
MQIPPTRTEDEEVSIPTKNVRSGPNLKNHAVTVQRKAAKRSFPFEPAVIKAEIASPPPQDEYAQARKRARLEKSSPKSSDEATTKNTSHDTTVALTPPHAADADITTANIAVDHADSEAVMDMPPNARAARALEEDPKKSSVLTNNSKKKEVKDYRTDWPEVAVLVPSQTLDSSTDPTSACMRRWTTDEDTKLKDAVQTHNGKNWDAIAALIPGRSRRQCTGRWHDALDPRVNQTPGRTDKWSTNEDTKLKDAVRIHDGKNWEAIAALVPGRTRRQCNTRWHDILAPGADQMPVRTGTWTPGEDTKLKDAVQIHGGKNWAAIAALIPGRTRRQCGSRWHDVLALHAKRTPVRTGKKITDKDIQLEDAAQKYGGKKSNAITALVPGRTRRQCHDVLDPRANRMLGRADKWTTSEDTKLKDAVQTHDCKNWNAIAALVPGRAERQCYNRWHSFLAHRDGGTPVRTGAFTTDEDTKLRDAVQLHGGKTWNAIAALVPGRTRRQCSSRWHDFLASRDDPTPVRTGTWTPREDTKLKYAVRMHGGKNWHAIAALVPGRTKLQCNSRWHDILADLDDRAFGRTDKWTTDEVGKLQEAVQIHNGKNWDEIAALVPGRARRQCISKWHSLVRGNNP